MSSPSPGAHTSHPPTPTSSSLVRAPGQKPSKLGACYTLLRRTRWLCQPTPLIHQLPAWTTSSVWLCAQERHPPTTCRASFVQAPRPSRSALSAVATHRSTLCCCCCCCCCTDDTRSRRLLRSQAQPTHKPHGTQLHGTQTASRDTALRDTASRGTQTHQQHAGERASLDITNLSALTHC